MIPTKAESSGMGGSICGICKKLIRDHSPEEFDQCKKVRELKESMQ